MSPWLAYLFGGASGIACTFLAQWWLSKRRPKAMHCAIRAVGDKSWCETCGATWPVIDYGFCGRKGPGALLRDAMARALVDDKGEAGRVLAASRRSASSVRDWVVKDDLVEMVRHRLAPRATEADHDENNIPMVGP